MTCLLLTGFMFTGAALVSGGGGGESGMLEGLIIEKLNGWDIEKRCVYLQSMQQNLCLAVGHTYLICKFSLMPKL